VNRIDVTALAASLPELEWPPLPPNVMWSQVRERWPLLRRSCEAAATRIARSALGLAQITIARPSEERATEPFALTLGMPGAYAHFLASDQIVPRIAKAFAEIYMIFGEGARGTERESERWTGLLALIAGVFGEWDLVATMTGGGLPSAVTGDPLFRDRTILVARHFAVIARTRATRHATAAMGELRARIAETIAAPHDAGFTEHTLDLCVALCAARIYFERAARVPDVPEAIRAWLAGAPLVHVVDPLAAVIAEGGDVTTTVFERYLPELSDVAGHSMARRLLTGDARSSAIDSAAVLLYVAREPLPAGWASRLDPVIAELLGETVDREARRASLADLKVRARHFRAVSNIALAVPANLAHALIANDEPAILMITGRGTLATFRPREIFGDDFRQLGRYLFAAKKARASPDQVQPAWLDFLARRSPRTSRLELTWRDLVLYQRIITRDLGGEPAGAVGPALRAAITGRA
jgi:hypothetical protein